MDWNLQLGFELVDSEDNIDRIMEDLATLHVAVTGHPHDPSKLGAIITVRAGNLFDAIDVARATCRAVGLNELTSLEVMPTQVFDDQAAANAQAVPKATEHLSVTALPEMTSAARAAKTLGVTPITVRRWIGTKLVGAKVTDVGCVITVESVAAQARALKHKATA